MFIIEVSTDREDNIDAFLSQEVVPENCSCTTDENSGCPGHCPLCKDPVDYCQGHGLNEWIMATLAWLNQPGPLSLFVIDDTCHAIQYQDQTIGYAVLHEGITSCMQWTVAFRVNCTLYYVECFDFPSVHRYIRTVGEMIDG